MLKISVIVPCYNQAQYLSDALQSVLDQTYENWECIVVNDGSLDNTDEIAKLWIEKDIRFKYLYQENGGLSSARNAAIAIAKGEYIFPLDADDKIASTLIEQIVLVFNKSDSTQLVSCCVSFFGCKVGKYELPKYSYTKLLVQNCFIASSAFKRNDWLRVGGYDETLKSFEDWDFWIRILNPNSKVYKINEVLFHYRKHEKGSLTNNFSVDSQFYMNLYDSIYVKNKAIYDSQFGNPILAFQENMILRDFNEKIKKLWFFKIYVKIKRLV